MPSVLSVLVVWQQGGHSVCQYVGGDDLTGTTTTSVISSLSPLLTAIFQVNLGVY